MSLLNDTIDMLFYSFVSSKVLRGKNICMLLFVPLSLLLFAFVTNGVTILVTGNIKDDLSEFRMNLCLGRPFIPFAGITRRFTD